MKRKSVRLLGLAWPLVLLPLMNFSTSEIPDWFAGTEGRTLISSLLSQIVGGVVGAIIEVFVYGIFGAQLPTA